MDERTPYEALLQCFLAVLLTAGGEMVVDDAVLTTIDLDSITFEAVPIEGEYKHTVKIVNMQKADA